MDVVTVVINIKCTMHLTVEKKNTETNLMGWHRNLNQLKNYEAWLCLV